MTNLKRYTYLICIWYLPNIYKDQVTMSSVLKTKSCWFHNPWHISQVSDQNHWKLLHETTTLPLLCLTYCIEICHTFLSLWCCHSSECTLKERHQKAVTKDNRFKHQAQRYFCADGMRKGTNTLRLRAGTSMIVEAIFIHTAFN